MSSLETTGLLKIHNVVASSYGSIADGSSDSGSTQHLVSFHNITCTVQPRKWCRKLPPKNILDDVSGMFKTGLSALMGPTGSGKTSLLDVLADRKPKKEVSGYVLINGRKQPNNFKCASAYVVQDNLLMGTLTVRENIAFSAALRLSKASSRERSQKVNYVMDELGLSHVADTKVGNDYIRGVSGGQKKRTSIGMELIISPGIVFLDEPTTGLDANTAVSVVALLKELSKAGRVIIISIHQPRYSIYKLFDSLTLMSRGRLVYHGAAGDAPLDYFAEIGYNIEEHNNPADFLLDVVTQTELTEVKEAKDSGETGSENKLADVYHDSKLSALSMGVLNPMLAEAINKPRGDTRKYATSFLWQLAVVSVRTIKNLIRDPVTSGIQILMVQIIAIVVGLAFMGMRDDCTTGVQDRIGGLFFAMSNLIWGSLSAVNVFVHERPIFIHQNSSGYYRVSTYFFTKVFCDLIPMRVIPIVLYSIITYWMVGFKPEASNFFFYMLILCAVASAGTSQAFFVGATIPMGAITILNVLFIVQMITGGYLRNLKTLETWIGWIAYVSVFRYGLNALAVNEFKDSHFSFPHLFNKTTPSTTSGICHVSGNEYLESLEFLDFNVWVNMGALFAIIAFFLLLSYISLRCLTKH